MLNNSLKERTSNEEGCIFIFVFDIFLFRICFCLRIQPKACKDHRKRMVFFWGAFQSDS